MDESIDSDIEMMEIDVSDNVISNKRKINSVEETNGVSNSSDSSPEKSPNLKLRPILRARRVLHKMPSLGSQESDSKFCVTIDENLKPICVLDTNILLSNLTELKNIILIEEKLRKTTTKSKLKSIVIPWIVLQELDGLKTGINNKSVVNVIHFINEQLNKTNGLIKGENDFKQINSKSKNSFKTIEEEVNDDRIINCCLKLKSIMSSKNVILITNDLNLCNKALITRLKAINWNQFFQKYNSSDLNSVETEVVEQIEPKNKRLTKNRSKSGDSFIYNYRLSLNEKLVNKSSGQLLNSPSNSSTINRKQKSPNKRKFKSPLIVPQKIHSSTNLSASHIISSNDCPLKYDDWIRYKDECEQKLLKFVENIYREIWENDWKKMLELDINNTNLKEIIRVIKKEWFANFSDHFNRDKSIKELVDSLHNSLLKSGANYHLYYKDLEHFVNLVQQKHKK